MLSIYLGTGSFYYDAIMDEFEEKSVELSDNIHIMEYINDMEKYLAAADLVISRSGSRPLASKKPSKTFISDISVISYSVIIY